MKICRACQKQFDDDVAVCPDDGTDLHAATEIKPGTVLRGKYEILSKLGEGGMGAVFKARHVQLGEIWALKVVASRLVQEPGFRQRFKSEALIMRTLNHPNDVRVQDYDETEDGLPFTIMEYVDGIHLDELVPRGTKMDVPRAVNLVVQVIDGLGAAHKLGIIHRDVKPDNILVAKDANGKEITKLLDFGAAKVKEQGELFASQKTAAGVMIGTPAYMSPEQVKGVPSDQLDGRVDLYAAAIILYELLCGRAPFIEKKAVMMLMAHAATPPPDPRQFQKDLPPALCAAILRALEKEPTKRFANAEEMREALVNAVGGAPALGAAAGAPATAPASQPASQPVAQSAAPPAPAPAAAPPPAHGHAQPAADDPEATAQNISVRQVAPAQGAPSHPTQRVAQARSHYSGKLPKAKAVVQYKQKNRDWVRIAVLVIIAVAIVTGLIWLLAPKIRKLSLSSGRRTYDGPAISILSSGQSGSVRVGEDGSGLGGCA